MLQKSLRKGIEALSSDRAFSVATLSTLMLFILFFLALILSLFTIASFQSLLLALKSQEVLYALKLSIYTATLAAFLCFILATPAAYALSRTQFKGKMLIDSFLDLPLVISPVALGASLLMFLNTPLGRLWERGFGPFVFEIKGIVLAQFLVISALALRIMKASFDGIDPQYEAVARTLGKNKWTAFFSITLPMARGGLLASFVLTWARAMGEFGATVTVAGATRMKTETLPVAIYLNLASAELGKAIALILILIIVALLALFLFRGIMRKVYSP